MAKATPELQERTVDQLSVRDERRFRAVPLYADLKETLSRDGYVFRVLSKPRWDRALFLNLTYWDGTGGDILENERVAADVIAHVAWHRLAAKALDVTPGRPQSAAALFLGESIASAFDAFVVGCLLAASSGATFLDTQVPAMAETARAAGLSARSFRSMLGTMAADPAQSFADLRELLYSAACDLFASESAGEALGVLERASRHRFGSLLHHYELSNWVLYARAYAKPPAAGRGRTRKAGADGEKARTVDQGLRDTPLPLEWLRSHWIAPALSHPKKRAPSASTHARLALSTKDVRKD